MGPLLGLGIGFLTDLVSKHGEKLVTAGVEKVTGIDLSKKELTPEDKQKILESEMQIKQLDFDKIKEENRHQEVKYTTAHNTYLSKNDMSDTIAKQIITRNLPIIGFLVLVNVIIVYFMQENPNLIAIVSQIIGIAIGNLFAERQAIVNFFFGSSIGSKEKDEQIKNKL